MKPINIRFEIYPTEVYGSVPEVGIHSLEPTARDLEDHIAVCLRDNYSAVHLYKQGFMKDALCEILISLGAFQAVSDPKTNIVVASFFPYA